MINKFHELPTQDTRYHRCILFRRRVALRKGFRHLERFALRQENAGANMPCFGKSIHEIEISVRIRNGRKRVVGMLFQPLTHGEAGIGGIYRAIQIETSERIGEARERFVRGQKLDDGFGGKLHVGIEEKQVREFRMIQEIVGEEVSRPNDLRRCNVQHFVARSGIC
ncbi:hypothetical protein [Caballeronia sp. KNU42]